MSDTFELTVTRTYNIDILVDTLQTAIIDGITYWADIVSATTTEGANNCRAECFALEAFREESTHEGVADLTKPFTITVDTIRIGLQRLLSGEVKIGSLYMGYIHQSLDDNSAYMIDSPTADCIVQAGILKEVRFG